MTNLDYAKAWACKHGLHVFPVLRPVATQTDDVACPCPEGKDCPSIGKHPAVKGWVDKAATDPDGIEAMFRGREDSNIGCVPGKSGHVVVDVDSEDGERAFRDLLGGVVPATLSWRTGRDGGIHRLYRLPAGFPALPSRSLASGLDVKSRGGFVALPPSLHRSGRTYTLLKDVQYVYVLSRVEAGVLAGGKEPADPPPQEELRAPSVAELADVVRSISNGEGTSREEYIQVGYAIKAAAGPENEGEAFNLYLEWASRWPGDEGTPEGNDPDTVRRDWDGMHGPFRVGWSWLQAGAGIVAPEFDHIPEPVMRYEDESGREEQPDWITVQEMIDDPDRLKPPPSVTPWLAWRRCVTLFSSREKEGKSTLATTDAVRAAREGKRVAWISSEESAEEVGRRFAPIVGEHADQVFVRLRPPRDWDDLSEGVASLDPDVIYVDTLTSFVARMQSIPGSEEKERWARLVLRFKDWAIKHDAGVVLVAHDVKNVERGEYHGSIAIGASVDVILNMRSRSATPLRQIVARGRFTVPDMTLRFDEEKQEYFEAEAADREWALEAALFTAIQANPGTSLRQLRDMTKVRHEAVAEIAVGLVASGFVRNDGTGVRMKLTAVPGVEVRDGRIVSLNEEDPLEGWTG